MDSTVRFIDLFAGIGGFHYGLDVANTTRGQSRIPSGEDNGSNNDTGTMATQQFTCVYSNEWDKYANSVYRRHYGQCDNRDIRTVNEKEIPDHDLLVGGFPCQAFSIAGKRGGFDDTRGTLFFEIARILKEKQPRLCLLENVKGLLSHDNGRTIKTIIATLTELGYDIQWQVLNSKDFGVPQNRERIYIVGHLRGTRRPEVFPITSVSPASLDYIGAIMSEKNKEWLKDGKSFSRNFPQGQRVYGANGISSTLAAQAGGLGGKTGMYAVGIDHGEIKKKETANALDANYYKGMDNHQQRTAIAIPVLTPDRANKRQNGRRFKEDGEESFTLTAQDKHGIYDGLQIRRLTPVECERLQGFPDDWTKYGADREVISDTQRYKMCGNAVTTKVITAIGGKLWMK